MAAEGGTTALPAHRGAPRYRMTLDLNVLNHLGLGLYSNLPAVLAEVVANAWDADAEHVWINEHDGGSKITVRDDGCGMTEDEVNRRYLTVGYRRRDDPAGRITPKFRRRVMGRKGIGKLSLLSVANEIEIYTAKGAERNALRMETEKIEQAIRGDRGGMYNPEAIAGEFPAEVPPHGTLIVLRRLKKRLRGEAALRRRVARWFGIIGAEHHFEVTVDDTPVTISDRGYWGKIEFLWHYGASGKSALAHCQERTRDFGRPDLVKVDGTEYRVGGWIGTVRIPKTLRDEDDNLNRVVLMVRNKLAEDNLLDRSTEAGLFTKYLVGELQADFLDLDELHDIATTSRQKMIEDDPRYISLVDFVKGELRHIEGKWTELRNEEGTDKALAYPAIKVWFEHLKGDNRRVARSLFGKIYQIPVDDEEDRKTLLKHAVLAFERMAYAEELDELDRVSVEDLAKFTVLVGRLDDIEAALYREIVFQRLQVIRKLRENVEADARERVIQDHLFRHLWLLDPAWERATDAAAYVEKGVQEGFDTATRELTEEERRGRLDLRYKTTAGQHLIVELKRTSVRLTTEDIERQVNKYRRALEQVLRQHQVKGNIETVVVLGSLPSDWDRSERAEEEGRRRLDVIGTRIVTYASMIDHAYAAYESFFDKQKEVGKVQDLIRSLGPARPPV
jgi:Histidine kinase-, DNA gyrase B-, and HSP90-like ATPase